ncbi:MAG: hypothetical protein D6706_10715 [Chloroflexi bacterium]|nr:MAG: hypothetical protein D6706_10715 [Chloroflexota bacterium]
MISESVQCQKAKSGIFLAVLAFRRYYIFPVHDGSELEMPGIVKRKIVWWKILPVKGESFAFQSPILCDRAFFCLQLV